MKKYEKKFEDDLKYLGTACTEKLNTFVLEQNDNVITHREKMLDPDEDDQVQAYIASQTDDAENIKKKSKETFVMYSQRIQ